MLPESYSLLSLPHSTYATGPFISQRSTSHWDRQQNDLRQQEIAIERIQETKWFQPKETRLQRDFNNKRQSDFSWKKEGSKVISAESTQSAEWSQLIMTETINKVIPTKRESDSLVKAIRRKARQWFKTKKQNIKFNKCWIILAAVLLLVLDS